jgi:hypothetical protein
MIDIVLPNIVFPTIPVWIITITLIIGFGLGIAAFFVVAHGNGLIELYAIFLVVVWLLVTFSAVSSPTSGIQILNVTTEMQQHPEPVLENCVNWNSTYAGHPNTRNPTIQECVNDTHPAYLTSCCDYKYGNDLYYQKMVVNK